MNKRKEERSAHRHTELSLMVIQQELCRDYDLELQQNRRTQNFTTTMPPIRHSRANVVHRTHTNQQSRDSRFNINKNKSSITCYGCNRTGNRTGHGLKECRSISSQKKREIFNCINGINNRNNHNNIITTTPHQHNNTRPPMISKFTTWWRRPTTHHHWHWATLEQSASTRDTKVRTTSKILGEISKNTGRIEFPSLAYHTNPEWQKLQLSSFPKHFNIVRP